MECNQKLKEISILIVIYNKKLEESSSFQSIINSLSLVDKGLNVVIWNNGPVSILDEAERYKEIFFEETLYNEGLAILYNKFIDKYPAEKFLILDDDSTFKVDFITKLLLSKNEISLPLIIAGECIRYPRYKGKIVNNNSVLNETKSLISIGSGLCISDKVVELMIKKYGSVFDENFYLYGVDSTFFYRLNDIDIKSINISGEIYHSLSKYEPESDKRKKFRFIERGYDLSLQLKYYPSIKIIKSVFKHTLSLLFNYELRLILDFLKCYLNGYHPRKKIS
ncbi:hypothetical protein [Photobacterium damselae]|uniref:Glycosyltransferase n=2 Tax=Photobacterium damselae TaxID=38293 RepID=A0A2T3QHL4_PHODM|nr:hypothetical protein [Photobacterium damselae]EEZ40490.1 putative glycosyl transferase [Photobacterium damselae subsp. damselae CIP 102761]PSW83996.1 hypothetical protein CTN07_14770 [Photobacterium damselae]SPY28912.1 Uncharacterised protein [Photobacterium damselae]